MTSCRLAGLYEALSLPHNTAAQRDAVGTWIAQLATRAQRDLVRRCLLLDAALIKGSFASLGSCLYARVLGEPEMAELAAAWAREMEASGAPWVRALRPAPLPTGLLAVRTLPELPELPELPADQLEGAAERLQLPSGAALAVWRFRSPHRNDKLKWAWCTATPPRGRQSFPQLIYGKGGRVSLVRAPGAPRIELPYTGKDGEQAKLSEDGETLIVYGGYDGCATLLDPMTLAVRQRIKTTHDVLDVSVCEGAHRVLLGTWEGLFLWSAGELRELVVDRAGAKLSPDGNYIANGRGVLQVWSVAELLAAPQESIVQRMPAAFDPTGERLSSHHMLYHGRTGELIAQLAPYPRPYVADSPAHPYQCTRRFIVDTLTEPRLWFTETGEEVPLGERGREERFQERSRLAYDEEGTLVAGRHYFSPHVVRVYPLPFDGTSRRIRSKDVQCFAISRDGTRIALATWYSIEVRDPQGALIRLWSWRGAGRRRREINPQPGARLRFSRDGRRLAYLVEDVRRGAYLAPYRRWKVWTIDDVGYDGADCAFDEGVELAAGASPDSLADFAPPSPADWQITSDIASVFTHQPSGTRVVFPASGPWVHHPHQPQFSAASHAHVELRPGRPEGQ